MSSLPGQMFVLHCSSVLLYPMHLLTGLSLLNTFVLVFCRVPSPQEAEQCPDSHNVHPQLFGGAKFKIVSWTRPNFKFIELIIIYKERLYILDTVKYSRTQFLQDFLQKFLTGCCCNQLEIWFLQPRFIIWLYFFLHIFLLASFAQGYVFLQFHFRPLGYVSFTQTIVDINIIRI